MIANQAKILENQDIMMAEIQKLHVKIHNIAKNSPDGSVRSSRPATLGTPKESSSDADDYRQGRNWLRFARHIIFLNLFIRQTQ